MRGAQVPCKDGRVVAVDHAAHGVLALQDVLHVLLVQLHSTISQQSCLTRCCDGAACWAQGCRHWGPAP